MQSFSDSGDSFCGKKIERNLITSDNQNPLCVCVCVCVCVCEVPNISAMKCIDQHEGYYLHEPVAALFVSFGEN